MILLLLRISLSLLWLRSCNKDFYKDFENSNVDLEVNEHKDYNIPKQYSLIRKDNSRSPNGKEHCNLNVAPRLCHQFEKISVNSNTENRLKYHKKIQNACHLCWDTWCTKASCISVFELAKLIGLLSSKAQTVLTPAAVPDSNFVAKLFVSASNNPWCQVETGNSG